MKKLIPLVSAVSIVCIAGFVNAKKEAAPSLAFATSKTDIARVTGTARAWAQTSSDIPVDDKVIYGTLDNGMRYIICKNETPPKLVSMRLHVDAGSLNEADDQRGVAHFLEHMVFNGTRHFPDATKLVPQMQRLGIAFGAHANAYTSFDETVYMLDLPNINQSTLDLGFAVMGDFADGALLEDSEIDEERGVIASEKTSRDSVRLRMFEDQFSALLPKSIVSKRLPIGTSEVIANAPRERFTDFYTRFYTPEKMTFVYVGNVDLAAAEKKIRDTFGSIKNPAKPGLKATLGDLSTPKGLQITVLTDKELTSTELSITHVQPHDYKVDSKAKRKKRLQFTIANAILDRRFSRLAKEENTKISSGSASHSNLFRELEYSSIDVTALDNNWKAALPVLETEFRRAIQFGFTQSEYNEVVLELINQYEQAVKSAPTRKNKDIASSLTEHAHTDAVYSTPETDLAILNENLAQLTPEIVHNAFKSFWSTQDINLMLTTQSAPESAKQELEKLYLASATTEVTAPKAKETVSFAYADLGKAGSVTAQSHIEDLDIHQLTLSNGIKVNFKKTDFEKNSVSVIASFGSGKAGAPLDKPGTANLASAIFTAGGLGKHSVDELQTVLAGRNVGVNFNATDESLSLSGSTTPKDLQLQLQLLTAYLSDPGFRPEAYRQYQALLPSIYAKLNHTEQGALSELKGWLAGGDTRFLTPTLEQAKALTIDDVKAWLTPQLNSHTLEISIIGDVSLDQVTAALTSTLGTLPERTLGNSLPVEQRTLKLPSTPTEKSFTYESQIEKAIAVVLWKADDVLDRDTKKIRRSGIMADILDERMRVELRENLGVAYSPFARSDLSTTFKNDSKIIAYSPGKPTDTEKVGKIIIELADKLAKEGATQDELDRVLKPKLGLLKKSLRQNSYWLTTVMDRAHTYPTQIEAARTRDADYASITLEQINALAKKFCGKENSIRISISPTK